MAKQTSTGPMIRLIKAAQNKLGLDDETYRSMLLSITGKSSTTDMDHRELRSVCDHLRKVGFKPAKTVNNVAQIGKIRALWAEMADAGVVHNRSEKALLAYVRRITKTERMEWCTVKQLQAVIETLKAWEDRIIDETAQAPIKAILEEQ